MLYDYVKRLMDIILSVGFIVCTLPINIVVAVLIYVHDWHSPIYSHIRIGKNKKPFKIYKFRSMVVNADDILFNDPNLYKKMRSGNNKVIDDPRVTKVGKFIRKYSIDEFPQIINVIKGEMSFIGPRALRPDEFKNYEERSDLNKKRLKTLVTVKPGITGYWQVSGRSKIDFDTRMDMECEYAKKMSLMFDLWILLKTPTATIMGEGAY